MPRLAPAFGGGSLTRFDSYVAALPFVASHFYPAPVTCRGLGVELRLRHPIRRKTPMHVIRRRGWEIPERHATREHLFLNRRAFLTATGAAVTGAAAIALSPELALAQ